MYARIIIAVVGLIEVLMPDRVAKLWVGLFVEDPGDVAIRRWVRTGIRLEGFALIALALWMSREQLEEISESAGVPTDFEAIEDVPSVETDVTIDTIEEGRPTLSPETTRFTIASALYHADDPLAVSDIVELAEGTDWEVGRSTASATLYRMYRDGIVDRRERDDGRGYVYWLDAAGKEALESADAQIGPNPFQ